MEVVRTFDKELITRIRKIGNNYKRAIKQLGTISCVFGDPAGIITY